MCALTFSTSKENKTSDEQDSDPIKITTIKSHSHAKLRDDGDVSDHELSHLNAKSVDRETVSNGDKDNDYNDRDSEPSSHRRSEISLLVVESNDNTQNSEVVVAVYLSLGVNILLLITKVIVFMMTFSYSVIASLVDSVLDLLSQFIIWLTDRKVTKSRRKSTKIIDRERDKYPVGKTRLEPVGILTVSVLMIMLSLTVIRESVQALITKNHNVEWSLIGILLLAVVVILKFLLWLYCRQKKFKSNPIAQALATDHINDVLSNSIALIVTIVASYYPKVSWLDPVGAICISIWIIWSWYQTGKDEVKKLVGRSADEEILKELKIICESHHAEAELDVLLGYHIGRNILVEVEMMMIKETTLEVAHDVCMDLQQKLEKFEIVERAFVHCDYMHRGFNEHKHPILR